MAEADMMGLIVKLEAQTRQFQRDFARATSIHQKAAAQMERRAKESADRMGAAYAFAALGDIDDARFGRVIERLGGLWSSLESLRAKARELREALPGGALPMDTGTPLAVPANPYGLLPPGEYAPASSPRPQQRPFELGVPDPEPAAGAGGGGGRTQDDYAQAVEALTREKAALDAEAVALIAAAKAGESYAEAIEVARKRAELLAAAQRDGKTITPELTAEMDRLARSYAAAGAQAEAAAAKMKQAEDASKRGAEAMGDLFTGILSGSMSAEEALSSLLMQIASAQMQSMVMGMMGGYYTDEEFNREYAVRAEIKYRKECFEQTGAPSDAPPSDVVKFIGGVYDLKGEVA